mmetsp:Transcript_16006/g.54371  ORF Transcript_16006/g.54371 Transcript_16006/m.54371 type:complete len:102 (-) Transcript_16006:857-1162(-)
MPFLVKRVSIIQKSDSMLVDALFSSNDCEACLGHYYEVTFVTFFEVIIIHQMMKNLLIVVLIAVFLRSNVVQVSDVFSPELSYFFSPYNFIFYLLPVVYQK